METIDPGVTGRRLPGHVRTKRARSKRKLPTREVMARYGVCDRTIDRWLADPKLCFPKPKIIRKRRYWDEADLDDFDDRAEAS